MSLAVIDFRRSTTATEGQDVEKGVVTVARSNRSQRLSLIVPQPYDPVRGWAKELDDVERPIQLRRVLTESGRAHRHRGILCIFGFFLFFLLWTFDDSLDEFFSMVCGGREAR